MNTVIRSLIAAGALSASMLTGTAQASHHFSFGLQAGAASAFADNFSTILAMKTGEIDEKQHLHSNSSPLIGLYGVNAGYHWGSGVDSWAATLSGNFASGHSSQSSIADDELNGALSGDVATITEEFKFEQQYNLMLEWHHQLSTQFDFVAGAGISAFKGKEKLAVDALVADSHYEEIRLSQSKTLLGPAVSAGIEYAINAHSSFGVTASYTTYHSTHFNDTADFHTGSTYEWCVINRRAKLNLFALTAGYSHQF